MKATPKPKQENPTGRTVIDAILTTGSGRRSWVSITLPRGGRAPKKAVEIPRFVPGFFRDAKETKGAFGDIARSAEAKRRFTLQSIRQAGEIAAKRRVAREARKDREHTGDWKSCAQWPEDCCPAIGNYSEDTHGTKEAANAVCNALHDRGFGGDRKFFPVRTWVERIESAVLA